MGPWATMCSECYMKVRAHAGLGTGLGQKYQRQDDGRFLKIRGEEDKPWLGSLILIER